MTQFLKNKRILSSFLLNLLIAVSLSLFLFACQKGEQGEIGPQGPTGATGAQGTVGAVGPAGKDGSKLLTGTAAPAATVGEVGDYYLQSTTGQLYGPKTASGWGGSFNLKGDTGATGPQGLQGVAGADGSTFLSGTGVPIAATGKLGDMYLDKATTKLYGPKTAAGWGEGITLSGATGTAGSAIHSGYVGPTADVGVVGDYFLNRSNSYLYGPKTAEGWSFSNYTDLKGLQGPRGATGDPGEKGDPGVKGERGSQIFSGDGAPAASDGIWGDYYLDKTEYLLYGPKTATGWGSGLLLRGNDGSGNVKVKIAHSSWTGPTLDLYLLGGTPSVNKYTITDPAISNSVVNNGHVIISFLIGEEWTGCPYIFVGWGYTSILHANYKLGEINLYTWRKDDNGTVRPAPFNPNTVKYVIIMDKSVIASTNPALKNIDKMSYAQVSKALRLD